MFLETFPILGKLLVSRNWSTANKQPAKLSKQHTQKSADGQKDFLQCPHCFRYYLTVAKLKHHIVKYCTKEKKFKCPYCEYRSRRKDHIYRHLSAVHSKEYFKYKMSGSLSELDIKIKEPQTTNSHNNDDYIEDDDDDDDDDDGEDDIDDGVYENTVEVEVEIDEKF